MPLHVVCYGVLPFSPQTTTPLCFVCYGVLPLLPQTTAVRFVVGVLFNGGVPRPTDVRSSFLLRFRTFIHTCVETLGSVAPLSFPFSGANAEEMLAIFQRLVVRGGCRKTSLSFPPVHP